MNAVAVTAYTDKGLVRARNEDAVLVGGWLCQTAAGSVVSMTFADNPPLVCAVADGMGGHAGGDLASRVALSVIADTAAAWSTPEDVGTALRAANERVVQVGQNPDLHGLGTTIAGVCVLDSRILVFNIGDSRAYQVNHGFVQQISVDDAVMDDCGRPTGVITQSLGQHQPIEPHITVLPRDGAAYLICSDGIYGMMSASALRAAALKPDPAEFAEAMIESVRANGAKDNLSFVLVSAPPMAVEDADHETIQAEELSPAIPTPSQAPTGSPR